MAIYHCSIKTIGRSSGRSATAAAAYRAGVCIFDERTGEIHDYTRKSGVEYIEMVFPEGLTLDREQLWNAAEAAENRKNSTVAREYEVALPEELNADQRKELAKEFARHLVERYGVAADVAIHAPGKDGDHRNHHAHILTTTRQVTPEGFGVKTRALDDKKTGEVECVRATWATLTNQALERAGRHERVSHKSLAAQGIEREPTFHLGPAATAMERRGERSERGNLNRAPGNQVEREELAALEQQQSGISAARNRVRQWRQEQARAAAEAKRQQELEADREKQRQLDADRKQKELEAAEKERGRMKALFFKSFRDKAEKERTQATEAELAKWEKAAPDERAFLEKQANERIEKLRGQERQRSCGMGMSR